MITGMSRHQSRNSITVRQRSYRPHVIAQSSVSAPEARLTAATHPSHRSMTSSAAEEMMASKCKHGRHVVVDWRAWGMLVVCNRRTHLFLYSQNWPRSVVLLSSFCSEETAQRNSTTKTTERNRTQNISAIGLNGMWLCVFLRLTVVVYIIYHLYISLLSMWRIKITYIGEIKIFIVCFYLSVCCWSTCEPAGRGSVCVALR